jgi:citronellol/citronellal dehydrogenase
MQLTKSPLTKDANRGKVAMVTGGGTGIGRATANALAQTGARVAICGRRTEPLQQAEEQIKSTGADCLSMSVDIRELEQVESFVDLVMNQWGAIDVLVNNAGGQFVSRAESITPKGFRAVHRLNVDGTWNMTYTVANRSMLPRRTGVIFFMGFSPSRAIPGLAHASAARSALKSLAASLGVEWAAAGVRCLHIEAGQINSEVLDSYAPTKKEAWAASIPVGRLGTPEDVAQAIAFLATDAAAFITATSIAIDGGVSAWAFGGLEGRTGPDTPGFFADPTSTERN